MIARTRRGDRFQASLLRVVTSPLRRFPGRRNALHFFTKEAEYVAIDKVKECLSSLFQTITLVDNPTTSSNSKRIDVRHHFLRELVENKYRDGAWSAK